jgi:hypothetical protein
MDKNQAYQASLVFLKRGETPETAIAMGIDFAKKFEEQAKAQTAKKAETKAEEPPKA